jgi:hypothetical protein
MILSISASQVAGITGVRHCVCPKCNSELERQDPLEDGVKMEGGSTGKRIIKKMVKDLISKSRMHALPASMLGARC